MKCLLCSATFGSNEELGKHYKSYHKIDPNSRFFQKLFQSNKNSSISRKCLRCDGFLTTSNFKIKHDFLKHYNEGSADFFEEKPADILKTANLLKFEITVNTYGDYYIFENSEEVVDEYLRNIHSRFKLSGIKFIKSSFVIENIQQAMSENLRPIMNTRFCTTETYEACYFNDFVFYGLGNDILS